jgi:hypothetical protein
MEYIAKKKEKQKSILPGIIYYKFNENIHKKEKINFTIISKSNNNILKKRNKSKLYNSKKNYSYNVLYNKLFFMLNFFVIFLYISSSKQNSNLNNSYKSEIIII